MDKVIATALLTIAAVIASVIMINVVLPGVNKSSAALISANDVSVDRVKTVVEIVYAYGDTTTNQIVFYVKNVGNTTVRRVTSSEVFLETPTTDRRIPYGSEPEYWTYEIVSDGAAKWSQRVTVKITIYLTSVETGIHKVKMVVPNGISADHEFSIS